MGVDRTGVYPGTFDPITSGHMEVVRRSLRLVDKLVIGPAINIGKGPLFSLEERIEIIKDDIAEFPEADRSRIEVVPFEGLLIHFARQVNASVIIRGLRALSDFEFEFQLAGMNRHLAPELETVFLTPGENYAFISSSLIREIARFGGDVSAFVPVVVNEAISRKLGKPI